MLWWGLCAQVRVRLGVGVGESCILSRSRGRVESARVEAGADEAGPPQRGRSAPGVRYDSSVRRKVSGRRRWRRGTPMHPSVFHLVPVRGLVDLVMCRPRATLQQVGHVHGQVGEGHRRRETTGTRRRKIRSVVQTTWPFKRHGRLNTRSIEVLRCGRDPVHREPRCH